MYHISLISRICFTNYRDFKSSLFPLLLLRLSFDCFSNIWFRLCYTIRHIKNLMWQIHGNLSFNLYRKGWFIGKIFRPLPAWPGRAHPSALIRINKWKQIFRLSTNCVPNTCSYDRLAKTRKSRHSSKAKILLTRSHSLVLPDSWKVFFGFGTHGWKTCAIDSGDRGKLVQLND